MANKNREMIISGDIFKVLKTLTIPMIFGIWGIVAFNLADTYFVGKLGTIPMAALTFTFPVILIINSLSLGLGVGTSAMLSHAVGENDKNKIKRLATDSILLGLFLTIIISIIGELTIDAVFKTLGADNTTLPYIRQYMKIWYFAIPINVVQMIGNNVLRGLGDTKTPSILMLSTMILNVILDPLLIFGIWIFPNFSVAGAAIATLVSRVVGLVIEIYVLVSREKVILFKIISLKELIVSWKEILYVGIPNAVTKMIVPLGAGIITGLIAEYGTKSVAGFGIATRIEFFALSIIQALTSVIPVFVGQNFGAKKFNRIFVGIKISEKFSFIYGVFVYIILFLSAKPFATIFTKDQEVINTVVLYLRIVPIGYFFYSVLLIINAALNALKKPVNGAILSLLQMFVIYIPLAFMLSIHFKIKGVFIALMISYIISGIISHIYIKFSEKKFLI